jgi:hypothetical protein
LKDEIADLIKSLQATVAAHESQDTDTSAKIASVEHFLGALRQVARKLGDVAVATSAVRRLAAFEEVQKITQITARRLAATLRGVLQDADDMNSMLDEFESLVTSELHDRVEESLFYVLPGCESHDSVARCCREVEEQSSAWVLHVRDKVSSEVDVSDLRVDLAEHAKPLVGLLRDLSEAARRARKTSGELGSVDGLIAATNQISAAIKAAVTDTERLKEFNSVSTGQFSLISEIPNTGLLHLQCLEEAKASGVSFGSVDAIARACVSASTAMAEAAESSVAVARLCDATACFADDLRVRSCLEMCQGTSHVEEAAVAPMDLIVFALSTLLRRLSECECTSEG